MVTTQQYSLRWNNYFRHLTYALDNHRADNDFVDVTLICDGRKIKAHKVVLSSCSAYFKEIFKENPHPHPVIIFKFIKFEDLNSIIEFMYQGEVNVQQEALQSFLQTAELLAVQGLTAEDKEKPKVPPLPLIDEQKLIKTIPSTIRPINESVAATQTTTQTIEIPAATLIQTQQHHQQQTQQQQPQHHHVQTTQIQHIQVQQPHHQPQTIQVQTPQHINQAVTNQPQQQHLQTVTTNTVQLTNANAMKKRKITFSDEDDNIYTTETVDYAVKDDQTIVKTAEMTFLRGTVKMDIPEYIVSEVDDRLSDGTTPQTSQDANNAAAQNVTQYTSEYEILTESEIEEKYQQQEAENAEITIEMGRLLNAASAPTATTTNTTNQTSMEDPNRTQTTTIAVKTDNKSSANQDLPSNKWTECQFCKMIITTVNLWRHIRTQHTPQPPRKCELCNKNFKNKYSLREHIRISHEQKVATKNEN